MPNTIIGGSPEVKDAIEQALIKLKKDKYKATVQEDGSTGEFSIVFAFGANDQTLKFKKDAGKGGIEQKIIEGLDI